MQKQSFNGYPVSVTTGVDGRYVFTTDYGPQCDDPNVGHIFLLAGCFCGRTPGQLTVFDAQTGQRRHCLETGIGPTEVLEVIGF